MLLGYYNSAILRIREQTNGIDKLVRLDGETIEQFNKRRADMIRNKKRRKRNRNAT
jgi:hypothetical protein